jgi:acetamidase/formamidase
MIKWLVELKGWAPEDAYTFCSIACDLRVTQLVDGFKGIHAMAARTLVEQYPNAAPIQGQKLVG